MTEAWFSLEFAQNLRWLAFLSLLSILVAFPLQGRYRVAIERVWMAGLASGVLCLTILGMALVNEQPAHVLAPFLGMGMALTLSFGATFPVMRKAYRDAELRKTAA